MYIEQKPKFNVYIILKQCVVALILFQITGKKTDCMSKMDNLLMAKMYRMKYMNEMFIFQDGTRSRNVQQDGNHRRFT